jgi:hypothetical protein
MLKLGPKQPAADRRQPSPWYAVSIVPGEECCASARMHQSTRWLSLEAPRLPIQGCDARQCDCRYRHHTDRRENTQRKQDRDGWVRNYKGEERRSRARGRRDSDI